MGCFLFQLPPSFHYTPERLKNILKQLEPNRRNVVEFRHASWWRRSAMRWRTQGPPGGLPGWATRAAGHREGDLCGLTGSYVAFAETTPVFGVIALALTFVVITGEIDLSFPSIMALGTAIFAISATQWGMPWFTALQGLASHVSPSDWAKRAIFRQRPKPSPSGFPNANALLPLVFLTPGRMWGQFSLP